MSTEVRDILIQILRLPQDQRAELDTELARIQESEWIALVADARQTARQRGIDDASIAHAVESLRYGDAETRP